jgi:hypothetical protein
MTFITEVVELHSSAMPRGVGVRVLLKHVVTLPLPEGIVRLGGAELTGSMVFGT